MRRVCLFPLASMAFCFSTVAAPTLGLNGIAAIANDAIITYQEVEKQTESAVELLRATYRNQPEVFRQKRMDVLSETLERLLVKQLVLQDFKAAGGALPDSIIDEEVKERIKNRFGDRVAFALTLRTNGMTLDEYRQQTRDEIIYGYMRQKNVSSAILISPQKIERYYATNLHQFKLGDQIKLRMIVLGQRTAGGVDDVKKLALEILLKLDEGAGFAEMASVYSEGSQRREGGDWGWMEQSKLNKGLSEIAFSLQPGQRSGVLALAREENDDYWIYQYDREGRLATGRKYTSKDAFVEEKKFDGQAQDNGRPMPQEFYLMLVEDKRVARTRALDEVRDEIERELIVQERARLEKKWVDRLKAKSYVRYF